MKKHGWRPNQGLFRDPPDECAGRAIQPPSLCPRPALSPGCCPALLCSARRLLVEASALYYVGYQKAIALEQERLLEAQQNPAKERAEASLEPKARTSFPWGIAGDFLIKIKETRFAANKQVTAHRK